MKHLTYSLFLGFILLLSSCIHKEKPDPCKGLVCDPVPFSPAFYLTIRDKTTNLDYFFSSPPKYPYSALTITRLNDMYPASFHVFTDTFSTTHSFRVGSLRPKDSLLLTIEGFLPDTLRFTTDYYQVGCCGTAAILSDVRLNSQLITTKFDAGKSGAVLILPK